MTEAPQALPGLAVVAYCIPDADQFTWQSKSGGRPFASAWRAMVYESDALALIAQQQRNLDAALAREEVLLEWARQVSKRQDVPARIREAGAMLARAALAPGAAGSTTKDAK